MLGPDLCAFSTAQSLHERVVSLSTDNKLGADQRIDMQKKLLILAGLMSECLMDYENPFEELRIIQANLYSMVDIEPSLQDDAPAISMEDLDKKTELGRSLARLYLDDEEQASRVLRSSIQDMIEHDVCYGPFSIAQRHAQAMFFCRSLHYTLSFEVMAHLFCDRVIDLKIAQEGWTTSDCLMAMAGLAGRYYAFAAIEEEDMDGIPATLNHKRHPHEASYKCRPEGMLKLISAEALRMGALEGSDLLKSMAANDVEYRTCPHLVYNLEPCFSVLAQRYEIDSYALKSLAVAKATGRMIAVACCGQDAEMEHNVARPLTVSSFIGSVEHFSPAL